MQLETTCRGKVRRCGGGGGREEGRHHGSCAASDPTLRTAPARGRTTTSLKFVAGMEVGGGRGGAVEAGAEAGGGVGEAADRHDIAPQPGAAHRHAFHPSLETRAGREGTSGSHLNMTHLETEKKRGHVAQGHVSRYEVKSIILLFFLFLLLLFILNVQILYLPIYAWICGVFWCSEIVPSR